MKFPTYDEMAKNVAEKVLDEYLYEGKTLREWVKEIQNTQPKTGHWRHYEGMLTCSKCGAEVYDDIMEYDAEWMLDQLFSESEETEVLEEE